MFTITIVFRDFSRTFEMTMCANLVIFRASPQQHVRQSVATRDLIQIHRITSPPYIKQKKCQLFYM